MERVIDGFKYKKSYIYTYPDLPRINKKEGEVTMVTIRPMLKEDISSVAIIHSDAFSRQLGSTKWVTCNFNAYPRIMIFCCEK